LPKYDSQILKHNIFVFNQLDKKNSSFSKESAELEYLINKFEAC